MFTIKLPKDFGDKKLTWTIVANGFTNAITLHTKADYIVEPFEDAANKNTPPKIKFQPNGDIFTGPPTDDRREVHGDRRRAAGADRVGDRRRAEDQRAGAAAVGAARRGARAMPARPGRARRGRGAGDRPAAAPPGGRRPSSRRRRRWR